MAIWDRSNEIYAGSSAITNINSLTQTVDDIYDTIATRVAADSGTAVNATKSKAYIRGALNAGYYQNLGFLCVPGCFVKTSGSDLLKIYDLGPLQKDFTVVTGTVLYDAATYAFPVADFASASYAKCSAFTFSEGTTAGLAVCLKPNTTSGVISVRADGGSGTSAVSMLQDAAPNIAVRGGASAINLANCVVADFDGWAFHWDTTNNRTTSFTSGYGNQTLTPGTALISLSSYNQEFYINANNVHSAGPTIGTTTAAHYAAWAQLRSCTTADVAHLSALIKTQTA